MQRNGNKIVDTWLDALAIVDAQFDTTAAKQDVKGAQACFELRQRMWTAMVAASDGYLRDHAIQNENVPEERALDEEAFREWILNRQNFEG